MNWQKLKSKIAGFFSYINRGLNVFLEHLSVPLNLFRFLVILLVVDFIAFMALTKSSYLQLVNPVQFLWASPGERLGTMELYFPRSLSLTGIENIYPDEEVPQAAAKPGGKNEAAAEKPLDEAEITKETILIKKRIASAKLKPADAGYSDSEATARRVMLELIAGPAGELETLKARNLVKEPLFLRSIWTHSGTIYISTEKTVWEKMSANEKKITQYCVIESLRKNLGAEKFVLLKE